MNSDSVDFEIEHCVFDKGWFDKIKINHYIKDLWPLVYILSDEKTREAYVGETTDTFARMSTHLKTESKSKLISVRLITSPIFNKSATLDIESNLIKYISGDGIFKLLNGNLGLANHNYYQKSEIYWDVFSKVWNKLRADGIAIHSIQHIDNSDLFKYSPYKSLKNEQVDAIKEMLLCINSEKYKSALMEGGAGTGKTILAIFLFKLLATENEELNFKAFGDKELEFIELIKSIKGKYPKPKMGLVVPMSSFRSTLKKVFKNIKGLKANMVIGPADVTREKFDILIVDESHRLRKRKSIGTYFDAFNKAAKRLSLDPSKTNELEWVNLQSKKTILFYDELQSIKPADVDAENFEQLKKSMTTMVFKLKSQFRVLGGNDYIKFIDMMLNCTLNKSKGKFNSNMYQFLLFDSVSDLVSEIKLRDKEGGLARTVAGFSWEWVSNKKGKEHLKDISIGDTTLKWNGVTNDWINTSNAVNEVGCIHTTQGYDLNYAGIIFGNEITYDKDKNEIIILKENYKDSTGRQSASPEQLKRYIVNIYKTMMFRGIKGTYVYACDKSLREYFQNFIPSFKNDIRESIIIPVGEVQPYINGIPLYDLKVAAGQFGNVQIADQTEWVKLPSSYEPSNELFACRVIGESMNKIIPNGSICLFKKYSAGSRNGKIVLVEYTNFIDSDFGSCYVIKEYESKKIEGEEGWKHASITLKALSTDKSYNNIELFGDEINNLKVIGIFECVLQ